MAAAPPAPVDEATLVRVRQHMHAVRTPSYSDKVYKDECMFTFDSPESPGGLYVNLTTFQVRETQNACDCRPVAQLARGAHAPLEFPVLQTAVLPLLLLGRSFI